MPALTSSAALVAWGNAWLTGHVGLDEAVDAIEHAGGPQVAVDLPGHAGEITLRRGLGVLRVSGLTGLRLALPVPGDPLGLPGPVSLNAAALEVGEAVLASLPDVPVGLVPAEDRRGSSYVGVRWATHPARPAAPATPALVEADQALSATLRDTTESLLRLDVACWRPELADALAALRESHHREPVGGLAPGYPARAHRVAALAGRLAGVIDLALRDEGGALTAAEAAERRDALRTLDRAVRRAVVAAYNSVVDRTT